MLPIIMWSSCFLFNSDPKISTDDLTEELKQHFEAIQSLRDVDDFNKFFGSEKSFVERCDSYKHYLGCPSIPRNLYVLRSWASPALI